MVKAVARTARQRPTDAELEILAALWAKGPSTVRQLYRFLLQTRPIHYNSVLKTLQIMLENARRCTAPPRRAGIRNGTLSRI